MPVRLTERNRHIRIRLRPSHRLAVVICEFQGDITLSGSRRLLCMLRDLSMSIRRLPGLMPNDPHALLTESQRLLVADAIGEADVLRSRAIVEAELIKRAESSGRAPLDLRPGGGRQFTLFQKAVLEGVRLILAAELRAYRAAGFFGGRLRQVIDDWSIDSLANGFELTTAERQLLRGELALHRQEYDLPEWLTVDKDSADVSVSDLCQLSKEAIRRLDVKRRGAESLVDRLQIPRLGQKADKRDRSDSGRVQGEVARSGVLMYVKHFAPSIYAEWSAVPDAPALLKRFSGEIAEAVVQLAVEHTRISHRLAFVTDWSAIERESRDWIAKHAAGVALDRTASSENADAHLGRSSASDGSPVGQATDPTSTATASSRTTGGQIGVEIGKQKEQQVADRMLDLVATAAPEGGRVRRRMSQSIDSHVAARRMEAYAQKMGMTEFATRVGVTDRTLRNFRSSGRVRRDILAQIAAAMGMTVEDLIRE